MIEGGVDATTLVAALGAGPPPPECCWGRLGKGDTYQTSIAPRLQGHGRRRRPLWSKRWSTTKLRLKNLQLGPEQLDFSRLPSAPSFDTRPRAHVQGMGEAIERKTKLRLKQNSNLAPYSSTSTYYQTRPLLTPQTPCSCSGHGRGRRAVLVQNLV